MSATKPHQFRPPLYHNESGPAAADRPEGAARRPERPSQPINDKKGWDAYRKWLSSMNGKPASERTPVDHSIYSWKGYQNWADQVRQSWKADEN